MSISFKETAGLLIKRAKNYHHDNPKALNRWGTFFAGTAAAFSIFSPWLALPLSGALADFSSKLGRPKELVEQEGGRYHFVAVAAPLLLISGGLFYATYSRSSLYIEMQSALDKSCYSEGMSITVENKGHPITSNVQIRKPFNPLTPWQSSTETKISYVLRATVQDKDPVTQFIFGKGAQETTQNVDSYPRIGPWTSGMKQESPYFNAGKLISCDRS